MGKSTINGNDYGRLWQSWHPQTPFWHLQNLLQARVKQTVHAISGGEEGQHSGILAPQKKNDGGAGTPVVKKAQTWWESHGI